MNTDRLLKLAAHLRTVPPDSFNLSQWVAPAHNGMDKDQVVNSIVHSCGTVACAVGHACCMPEFNKQGLQFGPRGAAIEPMYIDPNDPDRWPHTSWRAVRMFFGLDEESGYHLFGDWRYEETRSRTAAAQVADRIEQYVKEHTTNEYRPTA